MASVEDIANIVLRTVGYPRPISDLYDGTLAARVILDIYAETRDEVLQSADWSFAFREASLTAASAGTPLSPWGQEYLYPSDCVRVRYVKPAGGRSLDPQPVLWQIANETRVNPAVRVILCDVASAVVVYTGRVTDPSTWELSFTRTLIARLARRAAPRLVGDPNLGRGVMDMSAEEIQEAAEVSDALPPDLARPMQRSK